MHVIQPQIRSKRDEENTGRGRLRCSVILGVYLTIGIAALALSFVGSGGHLQRAPFTTSPNFAFFAPSGSAHSIVGSVVGGILLAAATIAITPWITRRTEWGRHLHRSLRPFIYGSSDRAIVCMALASGAAEELFFRGLLVPLLGIAFSSVVFGALHQLAGSQADSPGKRAARIAWMVWAGGMGLLLGALFVATGHILGPIVAHTLINAVNLRSLRDHDADVLAAKPKALGGLLGGS